jgi:hypothetical protein
MQVDTKGLLAEGARRVWRYQRIVWWVFSVNALLALFGVRPGAEQFGRVLDHSRHAQRLSNAFDVFAFIELAAKPEIQIGSVNGGAAFFAVVFFFFSLFLTGGILEAYRAGRKLRTAEFFHACGAFFWRCVRLVLCLIIVMVPIMILASILFSWADTLSDDAPQETLGFWVLLPGSLLLVAALMAIRLWFDIAQVRVVAEDDRTIRKSLAQALRLMRENFPSLFWIYFRISFLAWLVLAVALWIWSRMPPRHFGWSAVILEVVILFWFVARLWQRASETIWYERWRVAQAHAAQPFSSLLPLAPTAAPVSSTLL